MSLHQSSLSCHWMPETPPVPLDIWSPLIGGADLSSEQGGIAKLMVTGVDTFTCWFVAHKISLTCTNRVFLQLCGRLPRGRWTGGTGGWHGPGLQIEFHTLVKNQNITHKRKKIMMAVPKRIYPFIPSSGL